MDPKISLVKTDTLAITPFGNRRAVRVPTAPAAAPSWRCFVTTFSIVLEHRPYSTQGQPSRAHRLLYGVSATC
jgi:hypothetical protein